MIYELIGTSLGDYRVGKNNKVLLMMMLPPPLPPPVVLTEISLKKTIEASTFCIFKWLNFGKLFQAKIGNLVSSA